MNNELTPENVIDLCLSEAMTFALPLSLFSKKTQFQNNLRFVNSTISRDHKFSDRQEGLTFAGNWTLKYSLRIKKFIRGFLFVLEN